MLLGSVTDLAWVPAENNNVQDGHWACNDSSPTSIGPTSMHPCNGQCCQSDKAKVGIQYTSNIHDATALVDVTFEVWPSCGDGLHLSWTWHRKETSLVLFSAFFPKSTSKPHRESVEKTISLVPGDILVLLADPGENHDCDGVYVHDIRVWQSVSTAKSQDIVVM